MVVNSAREIGYLMVSSKNCLGLKIWFWARVRIVWVRICEEALAKVFSEEFEGGVPKELEDDKFEDSGSWGGITEDGLEEGKELVWEMGLLSLSR